MVLLFRVFLLFSIPKFNLVLLHKWGGTRSAMLLGAQVRKTPGRSEVLRQKFTHTLVEARHKHPQSMSLYFDAAPLLLSGAEPSGSLKTRVFSFKGIKSSTKQVYALLSEASKWSPILTEVIERSRLLQHERKVCDDHISLLLRRY